MSTVLSKRIFLLICVGCISTAAMAADITWGPSDLNAPQEWGIGTNWVGGVVPAPTDRALIGVNDAAVVIPVGQSYSCTNFNVGHYANNTLSVGPGATLTGTSGRSYVAREGSQSIGVLTVDGTVNAAPGITLSAGINADATIIVNEGGLLTTNLLLFGDWAGQGFGRLIMNGGLVDVGEMGSWLSRQTVILDLNDGVYDVGYLNPAVLALYDNATGSLSVDIDYGTWLINGDRTADVATMIGRGELVGFGGIGTVNYDFNVTTPGRTTVTATHPLNPSPEYKGIALISTGAVLEWDNYVDPNHVGATVTATVWFGTDPNKANPAVYGKVVDGLTVTPGTRGASAPQAIVAGTTYYWQVDFDNGSGSLIEGPVFEFLAVDNNQPAVSVKNVITWLDPPYTPGNEAVVLMDATVVDDTPGLTYAWTLEPAGDPNVLFGSTTIEDPTLTIDSTGIRTLTLTVNDGYWTVSASAEVRVYENPCWAARLSPGYAGDPAGDIANDNCIVNLADFAALAATWLDDSALTEYLYY